MSDHPADTKMRVTQGSLVSVSILIGACAYTAWLFQSIAGLRSEIMSVSGRLDLARLEMSAKIDSLSAAEAARDDKIANTLPPLSLEGRVRLTALESWKAEVDKQIKLLSEHLK